MAWHECADACPTYTLVCVPAGELYCSVVPSFWIFFVFLVLPIRAEAVGQTIIHQVNLTQNWPVVTLDTRYQHMTLARNSWPDRSQHTTAYNDVLYTYQHTTAYNDVLYTYQHTIAYNDVLYTYLMAVCY